jgi:hypothetical protein
VSYSIQDGISSNEEKLKAARLIADRFPDTYLWTVSPGNSMWVSPSAAEHVTDIDFDVISAEKGAVVYTYLTVEGTRVYAPPIYSMVHHVVLLHRLKKERPEVYKALVEFVAGLDRE